MKQVTGRDHRNVQCYIVSIITDVIPKDFVLCIRALLDFRYLAQSHTIDTHTLAQISDALTLFHQTKYAILDASAWVGKGNKPLDHFFIPKLELLHSVVPSICWSGAPIQWSADPTEYAHIDAIKIPSKNTNNGQYGPQICNYLDRDEKRHSFNLTTAIHKAGGDLESLIYHLSGSDGCDGDEMDDEPNKDWITKLGTTGMSCGPSRKVVNLFAVTSALIVQASSEDSTNIPHPLCTILIPWVAFNFNHRPGILWISVNSLTEKLNLPDLCPALLNFFSRHFQNPLVHRIGGW